jgi:DNA replication protein DnaC
MSDTRTVVCEKHGEYVSERSEAKLMGGIHEWWSGCPKCDEIARQKFEKMRENENRARERQFYERANIEPLYYSKTLDNFETPTEELKRAKDAIVNLIETKRGKIVMLGENGTGKTHLAVCAVKELYGAIYTMFEISTRIRATYTPMASEKELNILDELARVPVLVIDEIGRTKGSEAEENWLSYIIDKRNSRELPLILISNKHNQKNCKNSGCKDCIENYLSEDVMSRLCVDGKVVYFSGEDYRKKKR